MQYYYTAKSKEDRGEVTDIKEASNKKELANKLREEGLFLIEAEEIKNGSFFKKVSLEDKIFFTRNLRMMLSGGLSLSRSLRTISMQIKSKKLRNALLQAREEIHKGKTLSEALAMHPDIFSDMFISVIKLSEETGQIEENLGILIDQFKKEYQIRKEVKSALMYPTVITVAMVGVGIAMLVLVVPKLAETFSSMGAELPITTKLFIALGSFMADYWFFIPFILLALFFIVKFSLKTKKGKFFIDSLLLKIPVVSTIIKKINSAKIARTLSSLLSSGISIIKSLEIISEITPNSHFKKALFDSIESIKKGDKLSQAFKPHSGLFSFLMVQMIEVGEETGKTSEVLTETASFLEEEVFSSMKNLTSIIEPILMIIVGLVVGLFAFSMLIPIYSLLEVL